MADVTCLTDADAGAIHTAVVAALETAAQCTSDIRYRVALGVMRGGYVGRKPCDDTESLAHMRALLQSGDANSVEQAARFVARSLQRRHSVTATAKRLARKYRRT